MGTFNLKDVIKITHEGITCRNNTEEVEIKFDECVKNFMIAFPSSSGKCVATSDVIHGCYTFYTEPKTIIRIRKNNRFISFFRKPKSMRQFIELQQKIFQQGFTTYDLT